MAFWHKKCKRQLRELTFSLGNWISRFPGKKASVNVTSIISVLPQANTLVTKIGTKTEKATVRNK